LETIIGIVFFFKTVSLVKDGKTKCTLIKLSAYSIAIYLFHEPQLTVIQKLIARVAPTTAISQLLQFFVLDILIIVWCIFLGMFLNKIFPKIYKVVTGNR
jgi:membrane-bound acyltransferase YfiQ involved in biofilm formation